MPPVEVKRLHFICLVIKKWIGILTNCAKITAKRATSKGVFWSKLKFITTFANNYVYYNIHYFLKEGIGKYYVLFRNFVIIVYGMEEFTCIL